MKKTDLINNNVNKQVSEYSIMSCYTLDLPKVPSFIFSPFIEGWFWSENIEDLYNYLYEILIANYLIAALYAYYGVNTEDQEFTFYEAIEVFKTNSEDKEVIKSLTELVLLHDEYKEELTYLKYVKMSSKLEELLPRLGIDFKLITYSNPYEARHSKELKVDKFDFDNLQRNFSYGYYSK